MATIEKMTYPVDHDTLYQVYSKYGRIIKALIDVTPGGKFKALIQMENPLVARIAVKATNKQNIYSGANFLLVKMLKMKDLSISPSDKNAIDYTRQSNHPGLLPNSSLPTNLSSFRESDYSHHSDNAYSFHSSGSYTPSHCNTILSS